MAYTRTGGGGSCVADWDITDKVGFRHKGMVRDDTITKYPFGMRVKLPGEGWQTVTIKNKHDGVECKWPWPLPKKKKKKK